MATVKTIDPNGVSGRFPDYTGQKVFEVVHSKRKKSVRVYAPDADAAIFTAAGVWGERWTDYGFYSECSVLK